MSLLASLLLLACSDYALQGKGTPTEVSVALQADPTALALVSCGETARQVVLRSVGDAAVQVTGLSVQGAGWTLDPVSLPATLAPGEELALTLHGTDGDATLHIESSDPDTPLLDVPLSAVADAPPTVHIDGPRDGAVATSGELLELQGTVGDDQDAPADLALVWSAELDGVLSTEASTDGSTALSWAAADRSNGPQNITLAVTDSCGQTRSDSVAICQDEGYTVDELDISSWHFEGSAHWDEGKSWLELTPALPDQVGTAFATDETVSGDAVDIEFAYWIGGGTGADGLSLTVLDSSRMSTYLGGTGCGIGYGSNADCTAGPALPGWTVEVDTYYNGGQDPTEDDHVALSFDGNVGAPAAWAPLPEQEDTGWHIMHVSVTAPHVTVTIDGVAYLDADLAGFTPFPGYVGFTAGTGSQTNQHLIDALQVTAHTCE